MPKRFDDETQLEYARYNKIIGQNVRDAREMAGMSQDKLAQEIGRTGVWLSTIEIGRFGLNLMDLIKITDVLNKPIHFFCTGLLERPQSNVPEALEDWMGFWPQNPERAKAHYEMDRTFAKLERMKERVLA